MFDGSVEEIKQAFGKIHEINFVLTEPSMINYQQFPDVEVEAEGLQI